MTIDIETVCTHAQLANEIQGVERLAELTRSIDAASSLNVRQSALDDVVYMLGKRTPPIIASDIRLPSELRRAVIYHALEKLYREAMTQDGDVYGVKRKYFEGKARHEIATMQVTVASGERAGGLGVRMQRS